MIAAFKELSSVDIRKASIVLSMIEASTRPEPIKYAPEIAAYIHARRPSEIADPIVRILSRAYYLWAELEEGRAGTLADLVAAGCSEDEAVEMFVHAVQVSKWRLIASLSKAGTL